MDEPRAVEINADFYRTLWALIINGEVEQVKGLMAKFAVEKLDCVALFQVQIEALVRQEIVPADQIRKDLNYPGSDVIEFIAKHMLTDHAGFKALLDFLNEKSDDFSACIKVLNDALKQASEQVNRRVAGIVRGISRYRNADHIFFKVPKDVVYAHIFPLIADRDFAYTELRLKLWDTILVGRDQASVARLITILKLDLNETTLGRATFFNMALMYGVPVSMVKFLVEECGVKVTSDSVAAAAGIAALGIGNMSATARYLQQKLQEAEPNKSVEPVVEHPAP